MWLRRWMAGFRRKKEVAAQKLLQEQLDTYRLALLSEIRTTRLAGSEAPLDEHLMDRVRAIPMQRQKHIVQADVHGQISRMFNALYEAQQDVESDSTACVDTSIAEGSANDPDTFQITHSVQSRQKAGLERQRARHMVVNDRLRASLGYSLRVTPSTVEGAGRGLFLDGTACAGTVLCLYPGSIYLPADLLSIKTQQAADHLFQPGNLDLLSRFDSVVIDARETMQHGEAEPSLENPFASGQFLNHPTTEKDIGAVVCAYDFPPDAPPAGLAEHLHTFIPNTFVSPPGLLGRLHTKGALGLSIAFVACRDLSDEEIFVNYRLNPQLELPGWYLPVDDTEDQRRWGK